MSRTLELDKINIPSEDFWQVFAALNLIYNTPRQIWLVQSITPSVRRWMLSLRRNISYVLTFGDKHDLDGTGMLVIDFEDSRLGGARPGLLVQVGTDIEHSARSVYIGEGPDYEHNFTILCDPETFYEHAPNPPSIREQLMFEVD